MHNGLFRSLAILVALLVLDAARQVARSQPLDSTPRVAMPNDAFTDETTRGRITERFEMYNPRSVEQLRELKEMGFTQVILDWPDLHSEATAAGLDVVMANWWSLKTPPEKIESGVELAKQVDRQRLIAVSMMDEPERYATDTPFTYYRQLYQHLRKHFDEELPGVQLEISHWGPLLSWTDEFYDAFVPLYQATDRIRLMPYPDLFEGPLNEVYYQMLRSRRLMRMAERDLPQVVILQTWVIPDEPKLPTIDELRVMAFTAILSGAHTISFFNYDPNTWSQTEGFVEGFSGLMDELTTFTRQFADAEFESRMSPTGILRSTIYPAGGTPVSIVVNTNRVESDGYSPLVVQIEAPELTMAAMTECRVRWRACRPRRALRIGRRIASRRVGRFRR